MSSRKAILLKPQKYQFYNQSASSVLPAGTEVLVSKGSLGYGAGIGWRVHINNGKTGAYRASIDIPAKEGVDFEFVKVDNGHTYKFEKVKRDCPYNRDLKQGEKAIYDYNIFEDGKLIGIFKLRMRGCRGYELYSTDHHPVKRSDEGFYNTVTADAKNDFERIIVEFRHRIPTADEIAEWARQQQERAKAEMTQKLADERVWRMRGQVEEMYEILKDIVGYVPSTDMWLELVGRAQQVLNVIDTPRVD